MLDGADDATTTGSDERRHAHRHADQPPADQPAQGVRPHRATATRRPRRRSLHRRPGGAEAPAPRPVHRRRESIDQRTRSSCTRATVGLLEDVQLILLGFGVQSASSTRRNPSTQPIERRRSLRQRRPARSTADPRCLASAGDVGRPRDGRSRPRAARRRRHPDATACVSTRAASALLANTSACSPAASSNSSPTPSRYRRSPATGHDGRRQLGPRRLASRPSASSRSSTSPSRVTSSLRRQRHHRAQLLGVHVPRRHGVQPRVAERADVLRRREPPLRRRRLQARASASGRSCWKSPC